MAVGSVVFGREREQIAVLHVDEAGGHLGAFEGPADAEEIPAFVVGKRGVGDAVKTMASENDSPAEAVRAGGGFFLRIEAAESQVEAVQVFPHFAGDAVANGSGVFACFGDALHDGTRVVGVEGEKFKDVVGIRLVVELTEERFFAGHGEDGIPADAVRLLDLLEKGVKRDVEDAGGVFGAARYSEPARKGNPRCGRACQHSPRRTQVSLLPPPCEELTTRESSLQGDARQAAGDDGDFFAVVETVGTQIDMAPAMHREAGVERGNAESGTIGCAM